MSEVETTKVETEYAGRRIVMAIDESKQSLKVYEFYRDILRKDGDHLTIVHVFQPPSLPGLSLTSSPSSIAAGTFESEIRSKIDFCRNLLIQYRTRAEKDQIENDIILKESEGNVGKTLCTIANNLKPKMLILGTRGLGTVSRFFLGSVSDYVLHHAETTVCIVPEQSK